MNDQIPHIISQSFPQLERAQFLRRFASPVPLVPDTTFDIYVHNSKDYYVLVTTDYIDVEHQRDELLSISGSNELKIAAIVKPFTVAGDTIELTGIDSHDGEWFVKNKKGNMHPIYHYLATVESKL